MDHRKIKEMVPEKFHLSQMVTYYVCDGKLDWFQEFRA